MQSFLKSSTLWSILLQWGEKLRFDAILTLKSLKHSMVLSFSANVINDLPILVSAWNVIALINKRKHLPFDRQKWDFTQIFLEALPVLMSYRSSRHQKIWNKFFESIIINAIDVIKKKSYFKNWATRDTLVSSVSSKMAPLNHHMVVPCCQFIIHLCILFGVTCY